jgi:hypothetical protein
MARRAGPRGLDGLNVEDMEGTTRDETRRKIGNGITIWKAAYLAVVGTEI